MDSNEKLIIKLLEKLFKIDGLERYILSSRKYMLEVVTFNAANGDTKHSDLVEIDKFLSKNPNRDFLIIQEIQEEFGEFLPNNYKLITGCPILLDDGRDINSMGIVYNKDKFKPFGYLDIAHIGVVGSGSGTHYAIVHVFTHKVTKEKIKIINVHTGHNYGDNVKEGVIQKIKDLQDFGDSEIMITAGDFNELSSENPESIRELIGDGFNDDKDKPTHNTEKILDQIGIKTKKTIENKKFQVLDNYGSDHNAVLLNVELN